MLAPYSRKVLIAALLAAALSAPASANDGVATTQQSSVAQSAPEIASMQTGPVMAREAQVTMTNARISPSAERLKIAELRPSISAPRQPSAVAGYDRHAAYRPLILGIGY